MHNARNMSKVKGVKLQRKNDTRLTDDESKYEGLYNELKAWNMTSGPKARARYMQMQL